MEKKRPRFRLTPSLLNKFQDLLDADKLWEKFYGNADEPSVSREDYYAKCEKEMLDACNRVPFSSEAASKGTALNEIVDCILDNRPQREDMVIRRIYDQEVPDKKILSPEHLVGLHAELEGYSFDFDIDLVRRLTSYFHDCICQHRCEAIFDTSYGPVILYGDADYIRKDIVYDLKTTSKFDYGKFADGWQKHLYPYCLLESGELQTVSAFEYTVVPWAKGGSLETGEIFREWYDYSHESSKDALRSIIEPFLSWIEAHRQLITHPRIFNQQ